MLKKLTVEAINSKPFTVKNGPRAGQESMKYGILANDVWYGTFDKVAGTLQKGDVVEGDVTSREYNNTTYWDIKLPDQFTSIILKELQDIKKMIAGEPVANDEEEKKEIEKVTDDIPF